MKMRHKKLLKFRHISRDHLFRANLMREVLACYSSTTQWHTKQLIRQVLVSDEFPITGFVSGGYHTPMRSM